MLIKQISEILQADSIGDLEDPDKDIRMACGSDLMSDVLAFAKSGALLLTGLTNSQVVRTAEVAEIAAICFVRGKRPSAETIEMAREKGIQLLCTSLPMYESCGRLYGRGLAGCSQRKEQ